MNPSIRRKDFLVLTVTLTTLGMSAACGDDDDQDDDGPAGSGGGGNGGSAGKNTGGKSDGGSTAGSSNGGKNAAGKDSGGSGGKGVSGDAAGGEPSGGTPNTDIGGAGGEPTNVGGEGGTPGSGGDSNVGGSGGEAGSGPACQQATLEQVGAGHDHIPADPKTLFASFTQLLKGSNPKATFALPMDLSHSHNIVLTDGEVEKLLRGETITKSSTETNDHSHTYTISCG